MHCLEEIKDYSNMSIKKKYIIYLYLWQGYQTDYIVEYEKRGFFSNYYFKESPEFKTKKAAIAWWTLLGRNTVLRQFPR